MLPSGFFDHPRISARAWRQAHCLWPYSHKASVYLTHMIDARPESFNIFSTHVQDSLLRATGRRMLQHTDMATLQDSRSPGGNEDFACRASGLQSLDTGSRDERGAAHDRPSKRFWDGHQVQTTRLLSQESQTSFIDPSLLTGAVSLPMTTRSMPGPPQDQLRRFASA